MAVAAERYVRQCGQGARSVARRSVAAWGLTASVAALFLALVFAAPLLLASGREALARAIYGGFAYVCHQMPERSFELAGHSLAVCSRCTGIYAGFLAGVLLYPLLRSVRRTDTPPRLWLLVASAPIAIDWTVGVLNIWTNTFLSRFLTGAFFSAICAFFVVPGMVDLGLKGRRLFKASEEGAQIPPVRPTHAVAHEGAPSDYSSPESRI